MSRPQEPDQVRMSFSEHLEELRRRLGISFLVIAVVFLAGWILFSEQLEGVFVRPHRQAVEALAAYDPPIEVSERLALHSPLEAVFYKIKVSLVAAVLVGFPVLLWQMWEFIAAGLYRQERKAVLRFLPYSIAMAFVGIGFGYFFMVPTVLEFLYAMANRDLFDAAYRLQYYFSIFLMFTAALALIFQLPLVLMGLGTAGLVDAAFLRRYRRHFILGAFVVGALLTPPEPFSQVLMAAPTWLLYELGILLVAMRGRRAAAATEGGAGGDAGGDAGGEGRP